MLDDETPEYYEWTDDDDQAVHETADELQIPKWREIVRALYLVHGPLTPQMVVDFARPPGSPLHEVFAWGTNETDVLDQASSMLGSWSDLFTPAK